MTVGTAPGTGTVTTVTTSDTAPVTITGNVDGVATSNSIPAGALPSGMTVSTYPIANSTNSKDKVLQEVIRRRIGRDLGDPWDRARGDLTHSLTISAPALLPVTRLHRFIQWSHSSRGRD